jgi:mxaJ protein
MFLRSLSLVASLVLAPFLAPTALALTVCADPNNLPFSNRERQGLENRIIELVAADLGEDVNYYWRPQRRGFVRTTLAAHLCDVMPGVPSNLEMLRTTVPYYRSTYVFVTRKDRKLSIVSFDDPLLKNLIIGVQIIGDDGSNSPPAHALSRRGIINNVRGYPVYGNYAKPHPLSAIVDAVTAGEVDVAIVWGPTAGYFAQESAVGLAISPVRPPIDGPMLPMIFDISMGVRREDHALRDKLDAVLKHRKTDIDRVLAQYSVPRLDGVLPVTMVGP